MIVGTGIDFVEIERFSQWHTYSRKTLLRIFSAQEIDYCLQLPRKSAERFAVRFAAREALFKALSCAFTLNAVSFLRLCRNVSIEKINQKPYVFVKNESGIDNKQFIFHLSLSHSRTHATAFVIIEKLEQKV